MISRTTPIFDFHLVISALATPTPTPSLVKTRLYWAWSNVSFLMLYHTKTLYVRKQ